MTTAVGEAHVCAEKLQLQLQVVKFLGYELS